MWALTQRSGVHDDRLVLLVDLSGDELGEEGREDDVGVRPGRSGRGGGRGGGVDLY